MGLATEHTHWFRSEYEQEMEAWLRRRFGMLCIAYLAYESIVFVLTLLGYVGALGSRQANIGPALIQTVSAIVALSAFFALQRCSTCGRDRTLRLATAMILALGAISIAGELIFDRTGASGKAGWTDSLLASLLFWHLTASLFLPWTPRESMRPLAPLLVTWAAASLWVHPEARSVGGLLYILLSPAILLPGLAVSAWRLRRHGRQFHLRMVGQHFLSMRQELSRARGIHESLFPARHDDGHVRFEYVYTPAREIGGDFIHLHVAPQGLVNLTVIDVTGHGLAAALTVNRIVGELERIHAEMQDVGPGEVLALLNRYFYLTLARHQIFATAACFTLDPYLGRLAWASAGHPPAFLRGVNRAVTPLPATAVILGALPDEEFEHDEKTIELAPGDVLVAYTDGAFEARNAAGRQFGIEQLSAMMSCQPPPRNFPQFLAAAVERHAGRVAEDDVLIASLHFLAPRIESTRAHSPAAHAAS
jgi:hypothetical protein